MSRWLQPRYALWAIGRGGYRMVDETIRFRRVAIRRAKRLAQTDPTLSVVVYRMGQGCPIWEHSPARVDPELLELEETWRIS